MLKRTFGKDRISVTSLLRLLVLMYRSCLFCHSCVMSVISVMSVMSVMSVVSVMSAVSYLLVISIFSCVCVSLACKLFLLGLKYTTALLHYFSQERHSTVNHVSGLISAKIDSNVA